MPEAGPEPKLELTKGLRRMIVYGGILAFGAIGLSVLVRLPVFNAWLAGFLAGQLEASLGEDVVLEDVEVSLVPFEFRAAGLTVSHEGRVALQADAVRVDFDFYGLGGINTLHRRSRASRPRRTR